MTQLALGIALIEACSQVHGARIHGQSVGSFGDVAAWSFCQDKILTTAGEGGMVTTDRADLWDAMWACKDHGKTHQAVFGREHPPGFRWLHERYRFAGLRLRLQLPLHRTAERHRPHPAPAPARVVRYPSLSGSCSEIYLEKCFQEAGLAPAERLPVARELGETSLMFLLHPTITPEQMPGYAEAVRSVVKRACR